MTTVAATEFTRNFPAYREAAQREPVAVGTDERVDGYFISAREFEEYRQLKALRGEALSLDELGEEDWTAIRDAQVPDSSRELNHLLD